MGAADLLPSHMQLSASAADGVINIMPWTEARPIHVLSSSPTANTDHPTCRRYLLAFICLPLPLFSISSTADWSGALSTLLSVGAGRVIDLVESGKLSTDAVCFFVLDEADRLLDTGNLDTIMKLFGRFPKAGSGEARLQVTTSGTQTAARPISTTAVVASGPASDVSCPLAWATLRINLCLAEQAICQSAMSLKLRARSMDLGRAALHYRRGLTCLKASFKAVLHYLIG